MRIFSGHESLARVRCQAACVSNNFCNLSFIEELCREPLPLLRQAVPDRHFGNLFLRYRFAVQQCQDSRIVLGPADAESNDRKMAGADDPKRNPLKLRSPASSRASRVSGLNTGMNCTGQLPTRIASPSGCHPWRAQKS